MPEIKTYQRVAEKSSSNFFALRYGIHELNDVQMSFLTQLMVILIEDDEKRMEKARFKNKVSQFDAYYKINNDVEFTIDKGKEG